MINIYWYGRKTAAKLDLLRGQKSRRKTIDELIENAMVTAEVAAPERRPVEALSPIVKDVLPDLDNRSAEGIAPKHTAAILATPPSNTKPASKPPATESSKSATRATLQGLWDWTMGVWVWLDVPKNWHWWAIGAIFVAIASPEIEKRILPTEISAQRGIDERKSDLQTQVPEMHSEPDDNPAQVKWIVSGSPVLGRDCHGHTAKFRFSFYSSSTKGELAIWKNGSSAIVTVHNAEQSIATVVGQTTTLKPMGTAEAVVAIGMASADGTPIKENKRIALDRARHLARELKATHRGIETYALTLGVPYKQFCADGLCEPDELSAQRTMLFAIAEEMDAHVNIGQALYNTMGGRCPPGPAGIDPNSIGFATHRHRTQWVMYYLNASGKFVLPTN